MEDLSEDEMLNSLQRSGYLMETRIAKIFRDSGFFVEPSVALLDERTGISREVDMTCESYKEGREFDQLCCKTYFITEVINNKYPIAILGERHWSPWMAAEDHYRCRWTPHDEVEIVADLTLKHRETNRLFSQYCCFARKKTKAGELMACHSDDLHSSIRKSVELTLRQFKSAEWMEESKNIEYWRIFFWRPLIVLHDGLYLCDESKGDHQMIKVNAASLEYNFHHEGEPESIVVDFVVESYLETYLKKQWEFINILEQGMDSHRSNKSE